MITITVSRGGKPSSERAIAFARALLASKKETEKEMEAHAKSPEFLRAIEELRKRNATGNRFDQ